MNIPPLTRYEFDCDVLGGFHPPDWYSGTTTGFVEKLKIGDLELRSDFSIPDPNEGPNIDKIIGGIKQDVIFGIRERIREGSIDGIEGMREDISDRFIYDTRERSIIDNEIEGTIAHELAYTLATDVGVDLINRSISISDNKRAVGVIRRFFWDGEPEGVCEPEVEVSSACQKQIRNLLRHPIKKDDVSVQFRIRVFDSEKMKFFNLKIGPFEPKSPDLSIQSAIVLKGEVMEGQGRKCIHIADNPSPEVGYPPVFRMVLMVSKSVLTNEFFGTLRQPILDEAWKRFYRI